MNNSQKRRLWIISAGFILATAVIIVRIFYLQILTGEALAARGLAEYTVVDRPERGNIYDKHGAVLAANGADYQISITPNQVLEPDELATALAPILQEQRYQLLALLQSKRPYVLLAGRVDQEMADTLKALPYEGVQVDPMSRRFYPQGDMLCHTIGYVDFDGIGGGGLEGYYQRELAGEAASHTVNLSPLKMRQFATAREGSDLVLTIDRTIQYTVEKHLKDALEEYEATSGDIIVMDPRTGAIIAMASAPCFDPAAYYDIEDADILLNPIVSKQFEPGSVIKLITMAAALDNGTVTPQSTYFDEGELYVGGHRTLNWTREAHGTVDMTTLLAQSLNVGAATLALWMGADTYYDYMQSFGFGRPTGIDMMAEASGLMPLPGDSLWTESFLATNSYGQSIATTPLQMISAISALANDGKMMQPYIVQEVRSAEGVFSHEPTVLSQPVSAETAHTLTAMAVQALNTAIPEAYVPGFTVAGKTGTAQIAENGVYNPDDVIGTFAGWLPADDPEIVVYVKIDRPNIPWGSKTAAPTFSKLAQELVVLMNIPPDEIRLQGDILAARANE